jgi:type II secretory pathway component PulF
MRSFRYRILDDKGKVTKGVVELPFEDVPPAVRYLERQGGTVLSIQPVNRIIASLSNISRAFAKVKRTDLAEVLNNLSMLLAAGVPVLTAIQDVLQDLKNPVLEQTLKFICTDIESGQTFSSALSRHPKVFSSLIQNMCRIGEETGRLDEMLKKSADHLKHLEEIIGATKRALMYPSFLMVVVMGAVAFWFLIVVPQLVELFQDMGVELPPLTRGLLAFSEFLQNYMLKILVGVVLGVVLLKLLRKRSKKLRYAMDAMILRVPVISTIIETSIVARISEYLGILQAAGVGVLKTLDIIADSMSNEVFEKRLRLVEEGIRGGNTLSVSMRQANAMHPFAIRMISVGEQTGRIEEQTDYVASVYRERLSGLVEVLGKSLEPAMLVFLGLIFALVIGGLLLPIYDLMSNLGI